jgi:3-oxoacyl-[acyl-carrier-protein] synthase-1
MKPLAVSNYTVVSALGVGRAAHLDALRTGRTGLARRDFETAALGTWLGIVDGIEALDWRADLAAYDCRNNRLAELGLRSDGFADAVRAAAARYGAGRVGVFLGTSTSSILQTEQAYRRRDPVTGALPADLHYAETHNTYSVSRYVRAALGLRGPAYVVSTACSSSAKVYAAAQRMIALGVVDAAVVGGVDSLCMTTLYGFQALELTSGEICRPWDAERSGLSIGEAAAFALVEREPRQVAAWLLGVGESSDGHHMSSPHPEGAGAAAAMRGALAEAGLAPGQVDYLNLHGTGTPGNDAAEDKAVRAVFGDALPCSSTKGYTGHTLGAAGGVEAALSMISLQHGLAPAGLHLRTPDPALGVNYLREPLERPLRVVASNSFGFGGSNACLVFGTAADAAASGAAGRPMTTAVVHGIGLLGPGLADWASGRAALADPAGWTLAPTAVPAPARLPPTERRRAGAVVKASIVVADQAVAEAGLDPATLATVFASSTGDPLNCHQLCEALAAPTRMVSPTKFTNSVHNAAAGYWHIATHSMRPSTSLSAYDASFGAGLLEAMAQCAASGEPVLFVACDVPYPEPLHTLRPVTDVLGVALLLAPDGPGPRLALRAVEPTPSTACEGAGLEALRDSIPAARALPLLQRLARGDSGTVVLEGLPGMDLAIDVWVGERGG